MPSERTVKLVHLPLFVLITLTSIVVVAISGSLVGFYNSHGYPSGSYRDRIRILLVAGVWTTTFGIFLSAGFFFAASHILFGILAHLVPLAISFILFLIGSASLTALTNGTDCGKVNWNRCNIVKGLVVVSWIDTIWVFLALIFISVLAVKARTGLGARRSTLLDV